MELSWSDSEVSLPLFLERFKPPQIVQIAEGAYGDDDETTLSRGQELNLHLLKDMRFFSGFTELGEEIHIPFNSPHKVRVFAETSLEKYDNTEELSALFPHIQCSTRCQNPSDPSVIIEVGEKFETLYFDKDTQSIICLDKRGCEVSFEKDMLAPDGVLKALVKIEGIFMVEVEQRFSLPLIVQFMPQPKPSVRLEKGLINLQAVVVKQTVIATTRDTDCKTVLTFPSTLDVTVLAPEEAVGADPAYFDLCKHINSKVNLKKVEEAVEKDEQLYDDVKSVIKAIPYAESFFGSRAGTVPKENNDLDNDGYTVMDGSRYRGNVNDNDSSDSSDHYTEPEDVPIKIPLQSPSSSAPVTSPTEGKTKGKSIGGFFKKLTLKKKKSSTSSGKSSPRTPSSGTSTSPDVFKSPSSSTSSPTGIDVLKTPTLTSSSSGSDVFPSVKSTSYGSNEDIFGDNDDDDNYEIPFVKQRSSLPREREKHYSETKRTLVVDIDRKTEDLTVQEVGMLLHDLNLGQYGQIFEAEQVDGKILIELEKEILQSDFNMTSFHAHKLIKAVMENWRPTVHD